MDKYKLLVSNTIIFGMGTILSKSIVFLLLPLQTYALSQSEYGTADLVINTTTLLIPIFSMSMIEAAIRFPLDPNCNKSQILSIVLVIPFIGGLLLLFICFVVFFLVSEDLYLTYLTALYFSSVYKDVLITYCKGIDKNIVYSLSGVVYSIASIIFNYFFLIYFTFGIQGYFMAAIVANFITIIFAILSSKIYHYFSWEPINYSLAKEMLTYSWPTIFNTLSWWITNLSSRYMIAFYLGTAASAMFAAASKIPLIPITLSTIFHQAWELSAIKEFFKDDREEFFNKIYGLFLTGIFLLVSGMFLFIKPLAGLLFQKEFYDAWIYVPFLLVGAAVSRIPAFWGTIYTAKKKSKETFYSTAVGALCNIIFSLIFIPNYGIQGAAMATVLSHFAISLYRMFDTRKYIILEFKIKIITLSLLVLSIQTFILLTNFYFCNEGLVVAFFFMCFFHRKNIIFIYCNIYSQVKRNKII